MASGSQVPADEGAEMMVHGALRAFLSWDLAFWFLLLMTAMSIYMLSSGSGPWLGLLTVLAGLGLAYQFLGRRAIRTREQRYIQSYCLILVLGCCLATLIHSDAAFTLFFAMPQLWHIGRGLLHKLTYATTVLVVVAGALLLTEGFSIAHLLAMLPWIVISFAITVILGVSIDRVVAQSEQRASLIEELHRTRGELAEAHHAAGVGAERERMAREIHDTLAQGFTSIVMLVQAARANGSIDARTATTIEETARENLAEARALVAAFSPVALADTTLADALQRLGERFAQETGLSVDVRLDAVEGDAAIPPAQQVVLLRAAQEALANVRKHAGATAVEICLSAEDDAASIDIHDDGRGFDPASVGTTGFGLTAMRGRVEESGGSLELESAPGRGTRVHVLLPAALPTEGVA